MTGSRLPRARRAAPRLLDGAREEGSPRLRRPLRQGLQGELRLRPTRRVRVAAPGEGEGGVGRAAAKRCLGSGASGLESVWQRLRRAQLQVRARADALRLDGAEDELEVGDGRPLLCGSRDSLTATAPPRLRGPAPPARSSAPEPRLSTFGSGYTRNLPPPPTHQQRLHCRRIPPCTKSTPSLLARPPSSAWNLPSSAAAAAGGAAAGSIGTNPRASDSGTATSDGGEEERAAHSAATASPCSLCTAAAATSAPERVSASASTWPGSARQRASQEAALLD